MEPLRWNAWVLETLNLDAKQLDKRVSKIALPSPHSMNATEKTVQEVIDTPDIEEDLTGSPPTMEAKIL